MIIEGFWTKGSTVYSGEIIWEGTGFRKGSEREVQSCATPAEAQALSDAWNEVCHPETAAQWRMLGLGRVRT